MQLTMGAAGRRLMPAHWPHVAASGLAGATSQARPHISHGVGAATASSSRVSRSAAALDAQALGGLSRCKR